MAYDASQTALMNLHPNLRAYLQELGETGGSSKLESYPYTLATTEESQKTWPIPLAIYNKDKDTVMLYHNGQYLSRDMWNVSGDATNGYVVNIPENPIVAIADNNVDIIIFKNVPQGAGDLILGSMIADGTIPMEKLTLETQETIRNAGLVKTVNGQAPDETGNIDIALPEIVNDFTTGGADKAASAETVKTLKTTQDTHEQQLSGIPTAQDKANWNAMLRSVTVGGSSEDANEPQASTILTNGTSRGAPDNGYWYIMSFKYGGSGTPNIGQIAIAYVESGSRQADIRTRFRYQGVWSAWTPGTYLPSPILATLAAGWYINASNLGEGLSYYKDPFGVVHINGRVRRTDGNTSRRITTLPVGYRPVRHTQSQVTVGIASSGYVDIDLEGNIDVWFDGVSTNVNVLINAAFPTTT